MIERVPLRPSPQGGGPLPEAAARRSVVVPRVQRKLTVGRADDPAEREADRVAAEVVGRLRNGPATVLDVAAGPARVRRASAGAHGGEREVEPDEERPLRSSPGIGAPVHHEGAVLRRMEGAFGADFGAVRLRTGGEVDLAAEKLQARAFTVGRDVYIRRAEYRPGTTAGDELIAHELTHTLQQGGSRIRRSTVDPVTIRERVAGAHISPKKEKRHLDFVRMKRLDPEYSRIIKKIIGVGGGGGGGGGTFGHWWTEVGDRDPITDDFDFHKSYGWWPHEDADMNGVVDALGGVEGQLNAGDEQDPHAGETAPIEFHPVMDVDTAAETYDQIRTRVTNKIEQVATAYTGSWQWKLGWGKNCHTFQQHLKSKVGLHYQKSNKWLVDPNAMGVAQQKDQERQADAKLREANKQKAKDWHRVSVVEISVYRNPQIADEEVIETGARIGPTGRETKDRGGFEVVEIVTDEGEMGWIMKREFKDWTGKDWQP